MKYTNENYRTLTRLQFGDGLDFRVGLSVYRYGVDHNYLQNFSVGGNEFIFEVLNIPSRHHFADIAYGYISSHSSRFPECHDNDMEALTRIAIALFRECDKRNGIDPDFGIATTFEDITYDSTNGIFCKGCDKYAKDGGLTLRDGSPVCDVCYVHTRFSCSLCNQRFTAYALHSIDKNISMITCATCHKGYTDSSIHNHSYKPVPKFYANDYAGKNTYFGWELEVESSTHDIGDVAQHNRDKRWYFKLDGSLRDGVEIVSHPMTFEYMRTNKADIVKLLKSLEHLKCKSADTTTCGMHIHISKDTVSPLQLWKMLDFFRKNKKFVYQMSGRTSHAQMNRYASPYKINKNSQKWMSKKYWDSADKYTAINIQPHKTIEFRIFKGTLSPKKFFKNIEFVDSLLQWARNESVTQVTISSYCEYVMSHKAKYPNVLQFMEDNKMIKRKIRKQKAVMTVEL